MSEPRYYWTDASNGEYEILFRPDGTEVTTITEPEDRNFVRDLAPVCVELNALQAENARLREQAEALAGALRNQGLLQNTFHGTVWHIHDCPASFDFSECHYRCRVAREAFDLAGTEPYVSQETRRDTEVYE